MLVPSKVYCLPIVLILMLTACASRNIAGTPLDALPSRASDEPLAGQAEIVVELIFPAGDVELKMGQSTRFTVRATSAERVAIDGARVEVVVRDPYSNDVANRVARGAGDGIYRTEGWTVPRRAPAGLWVVEITAETSRSQGHAVAPFHVVEGMSEIVLRKYGFWIDPPSMRGMDLRIIVERGDGQNGLIKWTGSILGMHIVPQVGIEVHWRNGDRGLDDPQAVRRFVLAEGLNAHNEMRRIDVVERRRFKHWDAWWVACTTHSWEEMEWMIFYAPEADATYAIATILTQPPSGPDPHEALRESFAVYPEIGASDVAPKPFEPLLPGPALVGPPLATRFQGLDEPIVLRWEAVKTLAEGEYYEVLVTYYYKESNPVAIFTTTETELVVPESLYHSPNCSVFNWQVTLKRQAETLPDGQTRKETLSYKSLYWYFWWLRPAGEEREFPPGCPYTHLP